MISFFKKPYRYAIVFTVFILLFTLYISLDTFVIPRKIADVVDDIPVIADTDTDADTAESKQEIISTDTYYSDGKIEVTIITSREYDTDIYAADIVVKDPSYLKTAFANDECGTHIVEYISELAARKGGIVAINGDYYGFRTTGFVMRNGTLYRSSSSGYEALVITNDGEFEFYQEDEADAEELAKGGARQIFSFGPALIKDGELAVDENAKIEREYKEWVSNPRTAIGYVSPCHYMFVVSDGRTEQSKGLSLYQLASFMKDQGCVQAYNFDGGGSSELWFNGRVVNRPTGDGITIGERQVSDIVYVG